MKNQIIQYKRGGITYNAICLTYNEVDEFINQNPAYSPIDYIRGERLVYVTDELDKYKVYEVFCTCPQCCQESSILVIQDDYIERFVKDNDNLLLQYRFPYLNREERETLISGYCHDCQKVIFGMNYPDMVEKYEKLEKESELDPDDTSIDNEPF